MKGGNTDSKAGEIQGYDTGDYATFDLTGGKGKGKGKRKPNKSSSKFSDFDFEKEWKEFETSYNQKYGGATKKKPAKKPAKKTSSTKKPTKKASSAKKPTKRKPQRGGDESCATYAPAQFFDANTSMSAPSSDKSTGSLVDGLFPHAPNNQVVAQTGGAKKKTSKAKKPKTATKMTKPKKDTKKKDSKKDTKSTGKKVSVLDKIKKFFAM